MAEQERAEILDRAEKPLRVGAMCRSKRSQTGRNFFCGDICHIAVYLSALPVDSVRAHHLAGVRPSTLDSDRMYALAATKFRKALALAPDDVQIMSQYAQSVVNYLQLESTQVGTQHLALSRRDSSGVRVGRMGGRKSAALSVLYKRVSYI